METTTNKLGITKGKVSIRKEDRYYRVIETDKRKICQIEMSTWSTDNAHQIRLENDPNNLEDEENSKFISEAFNIANETGKTPRQLADENKMLLEALKLCVKEHDRCTIFDANSTPFFHAKQAIAKAEGRGE